MTSGFLRVQGDTIVDRDGNGIVMRGAALGGWMKYASIPRVSFIHTN
jgi:hypothetical protein